MAENDGEQAHTTKLAGHFPCLLACAPHQTMLTASPQTQLQAGAQPASPGSPSSAAGATIPSSSNPRVLLPQADDSSQVASALSPWASLVPDILTLSLSLFLSPSPSSFPSLFPGRCGMARARAVPAALLLDVRSPWPHCAPTLCTR